MRLKYVKGGWECSECGKVMGAFPDRLECVYCHSKFTETIPLEEWKHSDK